MVPNPVIVGVPDPVTVPEIVGLEIVPPETLKPLTALAESDPPETVPPLKVPPEIDAVLNVPAVTLPAFVTTNLGVPLACKLIKSATEPAPLAGSFRPI